MNKSKFTINIIDFKNKLNIKQWRLIVLSGIHNNIIMAIILQFTCYKIFVLHSIVLIT